MSEQPTQTPVVPSAAVSSARRFLADHGTTARAVVAYLGQKGARVTLVGEDGALGDVIVADVATGAALCEQVEGLIPSEWDRDTTEALTIGPAHRRRMAGRRVR
ncbi:hypothetical protein FHR81_000324 [Actinoalloteichus hoggarensis]|uniref:Uncharacterized protein n=1 Tax=Actinoalloteichus hoggarensis TaxID=1470176 RepID=A0A221W2K3_9PSEU|nr:hypothetical protein [Actinoalloteichus hoggarensis]ASO19995.1 hypothetical protein AHOG_11760 [Actinoalloteichus hoggarensis]MBB5919295.1 hypothetical protein [Actinoalloteichus hoggarensis]